MSSDLPDPDPGNIDGSKSVSYIHKVNHQIPWGQVALGVALVVAIAFVWVNFDFGGGDEQEGEAAADLDGGGLA